MTPRIANSSLVMADKYKKTVERFFACHCLYYTYFKWKLFSSTIHIVTDAGAGKPYRVIYPEQEEIARVILHIDCG